MPNNFEAQQESIALQHQYRMAHDPRRVWSAGLDSTAAVQHWYATASLRPSERRVELLELQEMAERLMDEHRIDQLDQALADRLNRDLVVIGSDVEDVDPLSAKLADHVAQSLFRLRHNMRLEKMTDEWAKYRSDALRGA